MSVLAPAAPPRAWVLAASADLPAGHALARSDLTSLALPTAAVPSGAYGPATAVLGRSLSLPMRRGEIVTDVRLAGSPLLTAVTTGGLVGAPVRIADAAAVTLLRAGDHIDVLGANDVAPAAALLASNVLVVSVPDRSQGAPNTGLDSGALVVLATTPEISLRLAHAAIGSRLSVVLRS